MNGGQREISVQELYKLQQSDQSIKIVDVRTTEEFEEIHAVGAIHVQGPDIDKNELVKSIGADWNGPVYFICRSGARSQVACAKARSFGIQNAVNIAGGTMAWSQAGYPVAKGRK
jgi:rhodanese-related sulfurtransferase